MTNKTVAIDLAQSLLDALAFSACTKCGESSWAKAQPAKQTKKIGFLTVRCKTCANKANSACHEAYREALKAARSAYHKERYATDEAYREAKKAANLAYQKDNPGKHNAKNAKRRASKLQATPEWAELAAIQAFYEACPEGHHVDHIVPLQGELVCGLHVLSNLQYLTAFENISKSNTFEV